ncbi:hypothetical protein ACI2IY_10430 [Lysobacter enzymogenes]|uniref:hypothetical protein n=1 Tax=Lysobacter enzymogenes TaxID=69 RepID=UPI00384BFC98
MRPGLQQNVLDFVGRRAVPHDAPRVIGSTHGGQRYLSEVVDLAAQGKVEPIVETFSLDRENEAYDRFASGKMRFRGVFTPSQNA